MRKGNLKVSSSNVFYILHFMSRFSVDPAAVCSKHAAHNYVSYTLAAEKEL